MKGEGNCSKEYLGRQWSESLRGGVSRRQQSTRIVSVEEEKKTEGDFGLGSKGSFRRRTSKRTQVYRDNKTFLWGHESLSVLHFLYSDLVLFQPGAYHLLLVLEVRRKSYFRDQRLQGEVPVTDHSHRSRLYPESRKDRWTDTHPSLRSQKNESM